MAGDETKNSAEEFSNPKSQILNSKRIIIIGGGLAGMATAIALESAGVDVTLIESRKSLGGRAGSFEDPVTGETLDNCQHVLLGCCTNLLDFYRRTGALQHIRWEKAIHFIDERGRAYSLSATPGFPAPLHLAMSGMLFGAISIKERFALARAMRAMLRLGPGGRAKLANISFGQWLDEQHQPAALVDRFYDLVLISALNEKCRDASAAAAIQVFQESLLANSAGYQMGLPAVPLAELYGAFPVKDVRLSTRANKLIFQGNRATGVLLQNSETISADAVVLAVNYPALEKWIPSEMFARDTRLARLNELQSVPILGAHLWFDRPILSTSHAALMKGPLQWLFKKPGDGSALHGVISAARDWVGVPKENALDQFTRQVRDTFRHARDAKLLRGSVVIEKRATFSPLPGSDDLRPGQAPPMGAVENLYLAGDYTQTGWPATMEGAVRSGYRAAEAIAERFGMQRKFVIEDLKVQWPAKFMGY